MLVARPDESLSAKMGQGVQRATAGTGLSVRRWGEESGGGNAEDVTVDCGPAAREDELHRRCDVRYKPSGKRKADDKIQP